MEVSDDGTVNISAVSSASIKAATDIITSLTAEAEIGKLYKGIVKKIADFGAFVEFMPGKDGLVHISQICHERIASVSDRLQEGQEVQVKVLDVDNRGRIKLSIKEAMPEEAVAAADTAPADAPTEG